MFLLWVWNTVPGGVFKAVWIPGKESPFIYGFGPPDALAKTNNLSDFIIIGERVTFVVAPPAEFKEIEMRVAYDKPEAPLFRLEAKKGPGAVDIDSRVLYSEMLQNPDWEKTEKDGFIIFKNKNSSQELEKILEGGAPVYTLGFRLGKIMGNGAARTRDIPANLRGGHIFWALPEARGKAEIIFTVQDANRHAGEDPIAIEAYSKDKIIKKIVAEDSGGDNANFLEAPKEIRVSLSGVSGPLKIVFSASDDIFIRNIKAEAARLVVEDRIFLGDDVGFGGKTIVPVLWSDGRYLRAKTPHREGWQKIFFAGRSFEIKRTDKYAELALSRAPGGIVSIKPEKGDVELVTSGFFAFSPEDFFVPAWPEIAAWAEPPKEGIIIAKYAVPKEEKDYLASEAKFDLNKLAREPDGSYRFFLSLPGRGSSQGSARIRYISAVFRK